MNHHLDQEVVVGFISEAKGYLPEIVLGLEAYAANPSQPETIKEAFRYAHIIKGAASMLGFNQLSELAYQLEITLERMGEKRLPLTEKILEDLCQTVGDVAELLDIALAKTVVTPLPAPPSAPLAAPVIEADEADEELGLLPFPVVSMTPPELPTEEAGETVLLEVPTFGDDILTTESSAFTAMDINDEEPLGFLLEESAFTVSLPETANTPTIGELDLDDVINDLKITYGDVPPPPMSEFELPSELLSDFSELQFALAPENAQVAVKPELLEFPEINDTSTLVAEQADDFADNLFADNLLDSTAAEQIQLEPEPELANLALELSPVAELFSNFEEKSQEENIVAETVVAQQSELFAELPAYHEEAVPDENLIEEKLVEQQPDFEVIMPAFHAENFVAENQIAQQPEDEPAFEDLLPPAEMMMEEQTEAKLSELPAMMELPLFEMPAFTEIKQDSLSIFDSPDLPEEMSKELLETFLLEAEEHLQIMHTSLRRLEKQPSDHNQIQEVRRSAHSLKGTAAMVGFRNIMQLAHRMEDLLDLVFEDEIQLTPELNRLLAESTDALEDMSNGQTDDATINHLYAEFARVLPDTSSSKIANGQTQSVIFTEFEDIIETETAVATSAELPLETEPLEMISSAATPELAEFPDELAMQAIELETQLEDSAPDELEMLELAAPVPVIEKLAEIMQALPSTAGMVKEPEVIHPSQSGAIAQASSQFVRVPIERLDEVVRLISEMIITRTAFEQRMAEFGHQVEELQISGSRLRRASNNLESKYEVSTLGGGRQSLIPGQIAAGLMATRSLGMSNPSVTHNTHGFDDLEFDRYTEFHLMSRELVEASNDIQTLGRELGHLNGDFLSYLNRQGRIYSELQDRLMRLRMVPLANIAPRLHRTVRTVSAQENKQVELILEGDHTAIDTTALQEIIDPLLHLLRNAVAHGIEVPTERQAKGKSSLGTIKLRAFYEGSQVVLQLSDDGKGLDAQKIRTTAIRNGYLSASEADSMSAHELWSLIFTPGFSTADQVSEISGRGVGMDVVNTTVQKLKGTISVDSQINHGTTFTIRLPLTLAVTRALMVKSHGQNFAIPLDVVTQIMRVEMNKVERIGKEPVTRIGGKIYPLMMLGRLLNLKQLSDENETRPPALMLNVEGKEVVVIVDQLMGGREIVIKTLGNHLRKVHGVMGATLMGDGEVVLILNLSELMRGTMRPVARRLPTINVGKVMPEINVKPEAKAEDTKPVSNDPPSAVQKRTLNIMIVDDSPSVRRVSSNLIKSVGWNPVQAKDGLDALDKLQSGEIMPDMMMLDIEMPRMDGYQLLTSLRTLPAFRNLPVVIVSSRSSEKHRQKAFDLGATDYLVKPYQEEQVIALIRRLVNEPRA